jgi:hypothetical protein
MGLNRRLFTGVDPAPLGETRLPHPEKGQPGMEKNNKRMLIIGAAAGTSLVMYGIRQGMRWLQRQQMTGQINTQYTDLPWSEDRAYESVGQPGYEPIPTTGPLPAAPPMPGMTTAERANSDRVSDFDDRGTAFTPVEMPGTQTLRL